MKKFIKDFKDLKQLSSSEIILINKSEKIIKNAYNEYAIFNIELRKRTTTWMNNIRDVVALSGI